MPKLLLIEDDKTMLSLLSTLLGFEGFEVILLEHDDVIDDILSLLRREKPALILLDVHLRQMDGFDVLHHIRQDPDLCTTRVLMSSGIDFSTRCREEGADGFILKPYMPEDLIVKISLALENKTTTN